MKIDLLEYLSSKIGNTNWYGDSLFDSVSSKNMEILDECLGESK